MFGKHFQLNEQTIPVVEEIGRHMPGGFFIYQADQPEKLLYANRAVIDIFGCEDLEDFKRLTGYTFRGMLHPDDYPTVSASVQKQIAINKENLDYVEYRIIRKDGAVRWVDDYGHYTETEAYGGIYYVFLSDITEKREQMESDLAVRQAVIEALSESYHTVWLINDVETETFSLYRGDTAGETTHAAPIKDALCRMKYSMAKEYYIKTTVAECDQERLQEILTLDSIVSRLRQKPQYTVNYLRKMEDGSEKYFRIEFAKVNMPGGKLGIVCGFKDVDEDVRQGQAVQKALREAKRAEEENRRLMEEVQSAAKLAELMASVSSLLTNMPAMSFSKDAKTGKYLACNQAFAEYAHRGNPEEVVGLTDYDIFDPETARHFVEDDQKALSMEEAYIFFEDVPDAGGAFRNLQTTKMKFTDTVGRLCLLGMCVDVSEMTRIKAAEAEARARQQEMEKQLALQEKLLEEERHRAEQDKLITALASDYRGVYYIELDSDEGVCYQVHSDLKDGFKVGQHFAFLEDITSYGRQYVTEEYKEQFLRFIRPESIREGLKTERVISFRYLVVRNGRESYEMIRFAGVRHPEDRDDAIVHAVSMCFSDVDAETRKNLDQTRALSEALNAAEQANRAKTSFLSSMSHEIRTPMNAIIGLDNIALNNPDLPEDTRGYLEKIGASAEHLLSIINDILDMSRIESGRLSLHSEEFSLTKALEQVNTMIAGQCRDKGLEYEFRILGQLDEYYIGDDMKLRQIMINILGNAVKFTPAGGKVTFIVEETARFEGKSTLSFTFTDTGIGMSREYLPKIFEPFSQEDSSSTSKYGSTGLGMSITRNLVELMNGYIEVESEKGKGSTFKVSVTLDESEQKEVQEECGAVTKEHAELKGRRILLAEDMPVNAEIMMMVLTMRGMEVEHAENGKIASEMFAAHEPGYYDAVLMDMRMPVMDGLETTRVIRSSEHKDAKEIPIIALTANAFDEDVQRSMQAGLNAHLSKPVEPETLFETLEKLIRA